MTNRSNPSSCIESPKKKQPPRLCASRRTGRLPRPAPRLGEPNRTAPDALSQHETAPRTHSRPPEGWWEAAFTLVPNASEASGHKCGSKQMLTLVAYDIREPKRLAKIAKTCEDFGVRIQYSVFECRLEADAFDRFWSALNNILDPETDRVTAYKVCAACAKDIRDAGVQTHSQKVVAYVF